jgi:hypothetical protein
MSQSTSLTIQIVTTIMFLLMIVPAYGNFIAAIMGMAQERATSAWRVVSGIVAVLSFLYPIAAVICVIVSWVQYAGQHYDTAFRISLIPGGWVVVVIALMGVLFGIIGQRM